MRCATFCVAREIIYGIEPAQTPEGSQHCEGLSC
jgi:hypothetical protein